MKTLPSLACCLTLVLLSACGENFLDRDRIGQSDENLFYQSESDAMLAVNAAYSRLNFTQQNNNRMWVFGDVVSDDAIKGGDATQADILLLDNFSIFPDNENLVIQWSLYFDGINNCNLVLDKVPSIAMDEGLKARLLGEAHFLRAYYYFELTKLFGPLPLYTTVLDPGQLRIPRATQAATWALIEQDATAAAQVLPVAYSGADVGRATQGAALALLAKAYLFQRKWQEVLTTVEQIKALGVYDLMPDYQDNFRVATENNRESVWEIQHVSKAVPPQGNYLNQFLAPRFYGGGYGFNLPTQNFVDVFEAGDPRLDFTVGRAGNDFFGEPYPSNKLYSVTGYTAKKYLEPQSRNADRPIADGDLNYRAIRFADVLLWEAEAQAELGNAAAAEVPLERVRARARAQASDPSALPPVQGLSQADMVQAIRHERRVELGFEMHRYFDLTRWGVAAEVMHAAGEAGFQENKHELFPIPQTEQDLNAQLTQNPGYGD
ncbi:Starch-binding associating with outer membrane [Catalinimonas alkaloidigena]|uniref:Starch-binding associating with outer membrane n=1 Tax=Catalinimonas alkaloidigena TaxID=1075417 RepID=A0A1G9E9H6_9BACT|nr:RagB/SusD family nutrient uptake outer membrane protein [Catalinimonas alkaloidigena]SDK72799.1 Starch-binding associating with outer membrane [Catalinimonas alkaloidigena]